MRVEGREYGKQGLQGPAMPNKAEHPAYLGHTCETSAGTSKSILLQHCRFLEFRVIAIVLAGSEAYAVVWCLVTQL
jgi:hypothetical protein